MPDKDKKRSLADDLRDYADGSAAGLQRMVRDARRANDGVPQQVQEYAGLAASLMPGYSAYESGRHGSMASRAFNEGDYGGAMMEFANGLDKGIDSLTWFIPGMGLIKGIK